MTLYNKTLLPSPDLTSAETEEATTLGGRFNIGLEPGCGTLRATAGKALALEVDLVEANPGWVELNWISGGDVLCRHPHVTVQICATSKQTSWIHPALRLHRADGFEDVFTPRRVPIHIMPQIAEGQFHLTPRQLDGCHAVDLHLFFEPRPNEITLFSLSLTAFQ